MSASTISKFEGYGYTYKSDGTLVPPSLPWRGNNILQPRPEQRSFSDGDTQSIYWSIRSRLSVRSFLTGSNFTNSTGQYSQPGAQWREALVLTMNGGFGQGAPRDGNYRPVIEGKKTARRLSKQPGVGRTGKAPRAVPRSMLRALGPRPEDRYSQHQPSANSSAGLDVIAKIDEGNFTQQHSMSSIQPLLPMLDFGVSLDDTWYDVETEPREELDEPINSVRDPEQS